MHVNLTPNPAPPIRRSLGEYTFAVALGLGLLGVLLDVPNRDFDIPFSNTTDSLFYLLITKSITDTGSPYHIPHVGAPFALDLHDFPNLPPVHVVLLKVLALGIASPGALYNAYLLLTFPMTIITSLYVLRHFHCTFGPALLSSLLFTFLPYHFFRASCGHFTLTCYFLVPLAIMVVVWVFQGKTLFFVPDTDGNVRFRLWHGPTLASVGVLFGLGLSDVYYSFFTCFMLLLAGLARAWAVRAYKPIAVSWLLIGVGVLGSVLCLIPSICYSAEHGPNQDAMRREMIESERFGLRIAQMLMPITDHRIPFVAMIKQKFNTKLIHVSENDFASMGVMASIGFLILIVRLLAPVEAGEKSLWGPLSRLNLFAVLLATIGGFGLLVAAVLPQIRSYNRISLFIAFFSLFAVALVLDKWQTRWSATSGGRWYFRVILGVLLIVGIMDQTPRNLFPASPTWTSDAEFIARLEDNLPAHAMIYQLPYFAFPEGSGYDHLRLSIQSNKLRWSHPVMRNRPADFWHQELTSKPIDEMLRQLAIADFQGICIHRTTDVAKIDLEKQLAQRLHVEPIVSPDGSFAFYSLRDFSQALKAQISPTEWQRLQVETLQPVIISWQRGFMRGPLKEGRWCCSTGTMELFNFSRSPQTVRINLRLRSGFEDSATFKIDSPIWRVETTINDQHGDIEEVVLVPPGRHILKASCDAAYFQNNVRRSFRVIDYKVRPDPPQ